MLNINLDNVTDMDFKTREAYKTLRSNVQFCGDDIKLISLTSCIPNEGKSMTSFNLAISMAETDSKVLFIDADLRKSVFIGRYKINKAIKGLTQYLSGVEPLEEVKYSTNINNLDMILSGPVPPNPAELLASTKFEELMEYARKNYDYVIVDTPPIGQVIDPAVVARQMDGVLFLISQGAISYRYAQKQVDQMKKSGCRILGVVLNKVDAESKSGYYSKYGYKKSKNYGGYNYGYGDSYNYGKGYGGYGYGGYGYGGYGYGGYGYGGYGYGNGYGYDGYYGNGGSNSAYTGAPVPDNRFKTEADNTTNNNK